ncbi:MAG: penicillin-binding protein [Pseudomonadota bacterium]|jgi:cell division protein FtsI (penicillin-binding protein 3)
MTYNRPLYFLSWRFYVILTGLILLLGLIIWRTTMLQVIQPDFLRQQGNLRVIRTVKLPASRGMIVDRHGEPFAISRLVKSIWINPKEVDISEPKWHILSRVTDIPFDSIRHKLLTRQDKEFVYLKRHVLPEISEQVAALQLSGVYLQSEYRRYYPHGEESAHVLGFTNIDDRGQEGIELAFNQVLAGKDGLQRVMRDRRGRLVEQVDELEPMQPGQDCQLSLDHRIQYLAHKVLKQGVEKHQAEAGSIVVLDVETGEVIAMANQPSFDPNMTRVRSESDGRYRNRAATDAFEPGSVLKTFSVAHALLSGLFAPETQIDTAPGWLKIGGHIVREDNHKNFGAIDIATIVKKSSNIGVSKLALALPAEQLWQFYAKMGFGQTTGSGFPGESAGTIGDHYPQNPFVLATMAFGYGVTVTPLQLAQAYAALGSGGIKRPVSFIKRTQQPVGVRVISRDVAKQMLDILTQTAEPITQVKGMQSGYRFAGKTGTARKVGKQGYQADNHVAVFAGLAPADRPRFAIVVMIDGPKVGGYYGGQVAAPLFTQVATQTLRVYQVPPSLQNSVPKIETLKMAQKKIKGKNQ